MTLIFDFTPNTTTASQEVIIPPAVAKISIVASRKDAEVVLQASNDTSLFEAFTLYHEDFTKKSGIVTIPPIPAGWHIKISARGDVTGKVVIG